VLTGKTRFAGRRRTVANFGTADELSRKLELEENAVDGADRQARLAREVVGRNGCGTEEAHEDARLVRGLRLRLRLEREG
jgi:hypothetical protein